MFSQDTNTIQYELVKCIAVRHRVSIVGDPDQSSEYDQYLTFQVLIIPNSLWLALGSSRESIKDAQRCLRIIHDIGAYSHFSRFSWYTADILGTKLPIYSVYITLIDCYRG